MDIGKCKFAIKGEISLDDVTLKSGYCETNEFFYCDFDSGICGFTNETVSKHYWLRATGKYAATYTNTGPNVDQTVRLFSNVKNIKN